MVKLSLIVPIYGVEQYIHKFLDSLEKNLQSNIEVLLIDDGTKDTSGIIADKFASKYPEYCTVIHKENGGLSSARNTGLKFATGQYILFSDPDDSLAPDYVSTVLNAIDKFDAPDIILFDYYSGTYEKGFKVNTVPTFKEGVISKESFIRELSIDKYVKSFLVCKAIKKSLYDGLTFNTTTKFAEDYELLTDLAIKVETIAYVPKPLYYYIKRTTGLTYNQSVKDAIRFYDLVIDRYTKHSKLYSNISSARIIKAAHIVIQKAYLKKDDDIDLNIFENHIKNNIATIIFSNEFTLNEKKQCLLVYLGLAKLYYNSKSKHAY